MVQTSINAADGVPRWIVVVGSLAIAFHLFAVVIGAVAAPSGPWPNMESPGGMDILPPQFAYSINQWTSSRYLDPIKMTHNYHFNSNRPGLPGIFFEVKLKDEAGQEVAKLTIPEANANYWVRHRQTQLANGLGNDMPVQNQQGEVIAAPNRPTPSIPIWDMLDNQQLKIKTVSQHLIPRDRQVMRPSQWSMVLASSYGRYLCRTHNAASAEIIRHNKQPIPPAVLFMSNFQSGAFDELVSNYGEFTR